MSDQAVEAFAGVEQTLAAVEEHLAVFKQTSMEDFVAPLSPLERAKKIKDAEELAKGPKLALDKEASKRFIHNALSPDQVYVDAVKAKKGDQDTSAPAQKKDDKAEGKGKRAASKSSNKKNKRQRKH
ncbi:unnamed protein product [Phytophthora lilii]|uniref:Unnamed protein product n=1 Tax=Phytophthora lilii TaxID=2077276 RepID=A0A9W6U2C2_9STRA|nr:unnamed protein product [Phytophthora lilii]